MIHGASILMISPSSLKKKKKKKKNKDETGLSALAC